VHDLVVDTGLAVTWIAAACVGLIRRPPGAFAILLAASVLSLIHGVMFSIATSDVGPRGAGVPFLVVGTVQLYLVAHAMPSFAQRERARVRERATWRVGFLRPRHSH
jgi:hypothetical protein